MQDWEVSCYLIKAYYNHRNRKYFPTFPAPIRRSGRCNGDEICVNGLDRQHGQRSPASCVRTDYFTRMISNSGKPAGERAPLSDLEGKRAQMVVSKLDGTTPLEVDRFDVKTFNATGNTVQTKECHDCLQLKTDTFGPDTNSLKAEATMLTTGAVAGILWLAVMSG